jgi:hypothetical protein
MDVGTEISIYTKEFVKVLRSRSTLHIVFSDAHKSGTRLLYSLPKIKWLKYSLVKLAPNVQAYLYIQICFQAIESETSLYACISLRYTAER